VWYYTALQIHRITERGWAMAKAAKKKAPAKKKAAAKKKAPAKKRAAAKKKAPAKKKAARKR
jgi:colicin import membrane protein